MKAIKALETKMRKRESNFRYKAKKKGFNTQTETVGAYGNTGYVYKSKSISTQAQADKYLLNLTQDYNAGIGNFTFNKATGKYVPSALKTAEAEVVAKTSTVTQAFNYFNERAAIRIIQARTAVAGAGKAVGGAIGGAVSKGASVVAADIAESVAGISSQLGKAALAGAGVEGLSAKTLLKMPNLNFRASGYSDFGKWAKDVLKYTDDLPTPSKKITNYKKSYEAALKSEIEELKASGMEPGNLEGLLKDIKNMDDEKFAALYASGELPNIKDWYRILQEENLNNFATDLRNKISELEKIDDFKIEMDDIEDEFLKLSPEATKALNAFVRAYNRR